MIPDPAVHPLLTVEEARLALGNVCSRSSFYEAVRRDELPGVVRIGSRVFVSTAALRSWVGLDDAEVPTPTGQPTMEGTIQ